MTYFLIVVAVFNLYLVFDHMGGTSKYSGIIDICRRDRMKEMEGKSEEEAMEFWLMDGKDPIEAFALMMYQFHKSFICLHLILAALLFGLIYALWGT